LEKNVSEKELPTSSPGWSTNTKLVIGLSLVAIAAALVIYFRSIIGPLLLAFILSFILHPVVDRLSSTTRLNWRMSVNIVFLVVLVLVGGLLTWSGLAVVTQFQMLIQTIQKFIEVTLPELAADLSTNIYMIGPFAIDLTQFDLQALSQQVLGILQPILGQAANIISTFATRTAVALGWLLFILVVAYFLLAEAGRVPYELFRIEIPGYDYDIRLLFMELHKIWNAFLRGQMIIFGFAVILNLMLLSALGIRFALGIAILAGVAKFIPYLGPFIVLVVGGVTAFFQANNIFGLEPWQYLILTLISIFILDQSFDNLVTPRLLGRTLNLHPAAILVAALIAFNLIGIVGLIVAAPVLATLKLLGRYTIRKLLDLDPWLETGEPSPPMEYPWVRVRRVTETWWQSLQKGKEGN
jgi:predicted PurR-regulated permease PerM